MFEAPNLDAMDVDSLRVVAASLSILARYARLKATAMDSRAAGRIADAIADEARCDRLYRTLPDSHCW